MTPDDLERELAAGTCRAAYLLAGEEALLREDALRAIRGKALGDAAPDWDLEVLDGERAAPAALADALRTLPVLAARRLVVLREPERARAGGLGEALVASLRELALAPSAVLVVLSARPDGRAAWVKAFADPHASVSCDPPRGERELLRFVRAEAERQGVRLGPGAAELLAERVGPQLLVLRQEIAKAALLAEPGAQVGREALAAGAVDVAEERVFELTDAIGEGRAADALATLHRLLAQGAPAPVVLGALASHMRRLARLRHGGRVAGPPFVVRKLEAQARRYRPARLVACLAAIAEADEVLKGRGAIPADLALERLVLGLAA